MVEPKEDSSVKAMVPFKALQNVVKPALEDAFGITLAANIVMVARNKSGAPVVGMNKDDYLRLIEAICQDERVIQMWGQAGTRSRLLKWQEAVEE